MALLRHCVRILPILLINFSPVSSISWKYQQNTSICNWSQSRVIQQRGNLLFDGGSLWSIDGYSDGTFGAPENDGNAQGTLFSFPLSQPFDTSKTNISGMFTQISEPNVTPINFEDGVMFGNDVGILKYGGLSRPTDSEGVPGAREVSGYQRFQSEQRQSPLASVFFNASLPSNMTRYVTNGAGASVDNFGFYFGGMRGQNWGPIQSDDGSASVLADTLISVNLTNNAHPNGWYNVSLPDYVSSRANAELVFIPASKQGVMAVIGGVTNPEVIYPAGLSESQKRENNEVDPGYMKTIPIFDIEGNKWYLQNTTGDIPKKARTLFCSVLASAPDSSSHNIYIYGGYDGLDATDAPYDDVYILSIPSFVWVKAYSGDSQHGRSGHHCFKVLPTQMLVVGGLFKDPSLCVQGGIVQIFNINTLQFQTMYSPTNVEGYRVPSILTDVIGGSETGGANRTSPEVWGDSHLGTLLKTPYTKSIQTWYPYNTTSSKPTASSSLPAERHAWILPVGLGIGCPILLAVGGFLAFFMRKRKLNVLQCGCYEGQQMRRLFHMLRLVPCSIGPSEADGRPVAQRAASHTTYRYPKGGHGIRELPAADNEVGQGPSICQTPTRMEEVSPCEYPETSPWTKSFQPSP